MHTLMEDSNMFRGLGSVLIIVIVLAFIAAFSFSETEFAAPYEAQAELAQVQAAVAQQNSLNEIDLPYTAVERAKESEQIIAKMEQDIAMLQQETADNRKISNARTEAAIADIQHASLMAQIEREQIQEVTSNWSNALVFLKGFGLVSLIVMVSIPATIYLISLARSMQITTRESKSVQKIRQFEPLRDDLVYRQWQIEQARQRERLGRRRMSVYHNGNSSYPVSNPNISA